MSENTTTNKDVRNDEIDLLDLFRRMGRTLGQWGNALVTAILISIVFILRRWIWLGLSILLGIIISMIMLSKADSSYTSDLILKVNIEPTDEVITHVNRLHTYCTGLNKQNLAKAIDLPVAQTNNILDINAYWVIDNGNDEIPDYIDYENNHDVYDTTNVRMEDRMDVRVRIKQPQELSNVREGIINFINKDPLLQQRNNLRLKQKKEMLSRLELDIIQLDSLQKFKYFEESRNLMPRTGNQMVFLQEQKTQLLYSDIYNLYEKKQKIELECDLYKDIVTILSDFSIPIGRDNDVVYYAKYYVPRFFIITLLLLILIANRRKIKDIYNKY